MLTELLTQFTKAVETGNGNALAALFTEDGVYHDTFYGQFTGRAAIAEMLEEYFYRDGTDFMWEMRHPLHHDTLGYASWTFSYSGKTGEGAGKRVIVEGMSRFQLENGLIKHYDEMFNGGIALTQLGFAPERIVKLLNRWGRAYQEMPANIAHRRP